MKSIAIVEDEELMREELADMLDRSGYKVYAIDVFEDVAGQLLNLHPSIDADITRSDEGRTPGAGPWCG